MADLKINICGIDFPNPVMAAAGPPTKDAERIINCVKGGSGGIVSKTISTEGAIIPKPCMSAKEGRFLNTELWSELTPEHWIEKEYEKARTIDVPLIIGLGYTPEQLELLVPKVDRFADAYEISCHYVERDISPLLNSLEAVKKHSNKPVFIKISPGISNLAEVAKALEEKGADALVAINSVGPCLSIDIETGMPRMGSAEGYGWMSGSAIKPIALRHVYELAKAVNIPVIGVGGVSNGEDVIEMFMAGASAVQICTSAILEGPKVFKKINNEVSAWLDAHGYSLLEEIKGLTIKKLEKMQRPLYKDVYPKISKEKCVGCGLCEKSCMYSAISMVQKKAIVDEAKCFACGLCVTRCNTKAIKL